MRPLLSLFLLALSAHAGDSPIPERGTIGSVLAPATRPVKVLALDADQTVRISTTQWRAPRSPSEVVLLPGVREKVADYNGRGFFVAIMSNQHNAVKDTGFDAIDETMKETIRQIEACGARIDYYDFSVTESEDKPSTTMIDRLEKNLKHAFGANAAIDRDQSLMVGDAAYLPEQTRPDGRAGFDTADFDRQFALNNHFSYREPQDFFGWSRYGVDRIENVKGLREYEAHARKTPASCAGN